MKQTCESKTLVAAESGPLITTGSRAAIVLPALIAATTTANPNTREAYFRSCSRFLAWCDVRADMADYASPRTTMLYDRSGEESTLDDVERIVI
jgi:hypothetical protein